MGCLGGDQIRFNFGVKIKYSLNTLRQHLANIPLTRRRLISWDFVKAFLKGDSDWANHKIAIELSSRDPACGLKMAGTITSN